MRPRLATLGTTGLLALGLLLTGCGAGGPTRDSSSKAQLAAEPSVTVVAVGDIACPPGATVTRTTCRQKATSRAAAALSPKRVIALGDEQYQKGRYSAFTHAYARSWGNLRSITWPVVGNHEYETTGARGYYRYFAKRQPGSPGYYRRSINGWQLYLLNSNCSKVDCAVEKAWLAREMDAHPSTCSLIAMHHPRFSSGGEHGSSTRMRGFWQVAYEHGTDVALSGHDHDYERFAPMTPGGSVDNDHGIQQFVSGGGGRSLYPKGTPVPGSQVFKSAFGVLKLSLTPTGYSWQFVGPKLRVRDSGSATCR
ncbi:MAG TPA: metallophosphoesterase [Marmoricola sp.]|nr:metallophosphoesterase [Marmoricola sp.]